jgi:hypothetical protein
VAMTPVRHAVNNRLVAMCLKDILITVPRGGDRVF